MIKKIAIGIFAGAIIGISITSIFVTDGSILDLFLTKITATSIITGLLCGIYDHLSNSKLQVLSISILIGIIVFYLKYLITGHDFAPLKMGLFVGAVLGSFFATLKKIMSSFKVNERLKKLRSRGFNNYF